MRRRDVLGLLCGTAAAWPLASYGQGARAPVIGFLNSGSPYEWAPFVAAFRAGLGEMGYIEGRNVAIEFRWEFGQVDQSAAYAADLVERGVDVIVTCGGNQPTLGAMKTTSKIPIIAVFGNDPIRAGMMTNIEHPVGNVTGVSLISDSLEAKQFELLHQIIAKAAIIGVLIDPAPGVLDVARYQDAARKVGQPISLLSASTEAELDKAFATATQKGIGALVIGSTAYFLGRRDRLAALAARAAIPVMYPARAYVESGGLISFGVDRQEVYRELGVYTGRIIRGGVTPAEMPVRQSSKFELVVNLKTAKALGVTVPPSLVTLADAVIQ
jgi:putative ABC transport system substrate-binding protein